MKKRSGVSSILVIMICFTVAVFGTFSVVSSANGKKLSNINYMSAKNYYQLNGRANEAVLFISDYIYEGNTETSSLEGKVKDTFDNIEIEALAEGQDLMIDLRLWPENGKGNSIYRRVKYKKDGRYQVLISKAISKEIEIDETEIFEMVE